MIDSVKNILKSPSQVVIIPHINPDGDALGSCLGLSIFLRKLGHQTTVVAPNGFPTFYDWMPFANEIVFFNEEAEKATNHLNTANLVCCLDYNDLSRIGDMGAIVGALETPVLMIDHHQQPTDFADITISDSSKSSTSEMVYDFIKEWGGLSHVDQDLAECLYTGILTDTGSFRFGSTTPNTHIAAAFLLEKGVESDKIYSLVYDNNTLDRLHLTGYALVEKLKTIGNLGASYISLTEEEQERFNFQKGDSEGLVNYGLAMKGMLFTAFFRESEGYIKISLRSKGEFDVNQIARKYFNGGGHRNAAGGRVSYTMEETISLFTKVVEEHKSELI